jgi:tetratricopeptide (TPR) repeat protein
VGDQVLVVGSPLGLADTVSGGIVSAVPEDRQSIADLTPATLQITAAISEGSSGGPVLNLKGEVIGVATAFLRGGEALNFAVPLENLLTLKQTAPVSFRQWRHPRSSANALDLYIAGLAYMQLDKYAEGLRTFEAAVEMNQTFAPAWWGAGVCLFSLGSKDKAIRVLQNAALLDPKLSLPHYTLGEIYLSQRDKESASRQYEILKVI